MKAQIKEMAKVIMDGEIARNAGFIDCSEFPTDDVIEVGMQRLAGAKALYNANYRRVIHCKDCAYRDTEGCPNTYWNGGELESNVEDDSFCSGAKMKGGAE